MRKDQSEIKERVNKQSNIRYSERTKTRIPSAPPLQFSAFSSSNFCARVIYIEKMAPDESLYVVFSRKAGEKPGFWYEGSWGSCGCMSFTLYGRLESGCTRPRVGRKFPRHLGKLCSNPPCPVTPVAPGSHYRSVHSHRVSSRQLPVSNYL